MANIYVPKSNDLVPSVFDDFLNPWNEWLGVSGLRGKQLTVPPVNIIETDNDFLVSLAAPGLEKDDFLVNIEGNILTITSEKEESSEETEDLFTRNEYNYSSFSRSFTLPEDVNQDKIEAAYINGVLQLTLPKKEEARKAALSKNISVK